MTEGTTLRQFARYGIVGLCSNLVLYLAYLALTGIGVAPKVAMSVLYVLGTLQTFVFNKRWSFRSGGNHRPQLLRYLAAYAGGYALNLAALAVLVDRLGLPHQAVQGAMVLLLALLLFALQKFWVFPAGMHRDTGSTP